MVGMNKKTIATRPVLRGWTQKGLSNSTPLRGGRETQGRQTASLAKKSVCKGNKSLNGREEKTGSSRTGLKNMNKKEIWEGGKRSRGKRRAHRRRQPTSAVLKSTKKTKRMRIKKIIG